MPITTKPNQIADMRLVSITGSNFRHLTELNVIFPDGLIGIVGLNGAGKSTLAEAIAFAFSGMAAIREGHTKENLIRKGSEADLKIELIFILGEHTYRVERELSAKSLSPSAKLWRNDDPKPIARGVDNVNVKIATLIGSFDDLKISRFVRQNGLSELSNKQPADRKREILKLLGINAVEEAIRDLRKTIAELDKSIKERQNLLPNLPELTALINSLEKQRKGILATQNNQRKELEERTGELDQLESQLTVLDQRSEKLARSTVTRSMAQEGLDEIKNRLSELLQSDQRLAGVAEELTRSEAQLAQIELHRGELSELQKLYELRSLAETMEVQEKALKQKITELETTLQKYEAQAAREPGLNTEINKLKLSIAGATADEATAAAARERLKSEGEQILTDLRGLKVQIERMTSDPTSMETCPTCGQPITMEHLLNNQKNKEAEKTRIVTQGTAAKNKMEGAASLKNTGAARVQTLEGELVGVHRAEAEVRVLRPNLEDRRQELRVVSQQIKDARSLPFDTDRYGSLASEANDVQSLLTLIANARGELTEQERNNLERERLLGRQVNYKEQLASATKDLKASGYDPGAHEELKEKVRELREVVSAARVEQTRLAGEMALTESQIKNEKEKEQAFNARNAEISHLLVDRGDLKVTLDWMERFKTELIGRIRPALSRKASKLLAILSDGYFMDLTLTADYDIRFGIASDQDSIKMASGAYEDMLNLCLRLAISELINESLGVGRSFLVLDEIVGKMDVERESAIMDFLPKLSGHFSQILMIEHKPTAQNRFESVIEVKLDKTTRTSTIFYPPRKPDEIVPILTETVVESSPPAKTRHGAKKAKAAGPLVAVQA